MEWCVWECASGVHTGPWIWPLPHAAIYLSAQQARSQPQKEPVPGRTRSHPCVPGLRAGTVITHQPAPVLHQPRSPFWFPHLPLS